MFILFVNNLFSQIDTSNDSIRKELKFEFINFHVKFKGNDTIYYVKFFIDTELYEVHDKFVKRSRNKYEIILTNGHKQYGNFRKFTIYNNPFKDFKFMEKIGLWKEYDSNDVLINTIDYNNLKYKSIRFFPKGRISYKNRNYK